MKQIEISPILKQYRKNVGNWYIENISGLKFQMINVEPVEYENDNFNVRIIMKCNSKEINSSYPAFELDFSLTNE